MSLSLQSIEILLDLVEIKIGYMQVHDRDDAREQLKLRLCRQELLDLEAKLKKAKTKQKVVKISKKTLSLITPKN